MAVTELDNSGERRNRNVAPRQRKYVVPSLSRYGTLADLTRNNGSKNLNDGSAPPGCGMNNFATSCIM
jgi:hypothetical protein